MTQEEKELLLRDLCARLPYGVKCQIDYDNEEDTDLGIERYRDDRIVSVCTETEEIGLYEESVYSPPEYVKPYLFPLSSMTEEQREELKQEHIKDEKLYVECLTRAAKGDNSMRGKVIIHYAMDWCNANHFDYRGLIPMGLAIDATGLDVY